ncbi:MAG: 50S ribosomal protein L15 [Bacteroidota bacterium]
MELHNLKPAKGAVKTSKRVGRGQGSGKGGTSKRGHKGQKSRSGYSSKRAFEGGGITLWKRTPKRGFKNINRVEYVPINLDRLQAIVDKHGLTDVTVENLAAVGIVSKNDKVKVLGNGELTSKLNITVHACSNTAKEAIESKGGTVNLV